MPQIEWKIDLGNVITVGVLVLSGAIAWGTMSTKLDNYALIVAELKADVKELRVTLEEVRAQQLTTSVELKLRQDAEARSRR